MCSKVQLSTLFHNWVLKCFGSNKINFIVAFKPLLMYNKAVKLKLIRG